MQIAHLVHLVRTVLLLLHLHRHCRQSLSCNSHAMRHEISTGFIVTVLLMSCAYSDCIVSKVVPDLCAICCFFLSSRSGGLDADKKGASILSRRRDFAQLDFSSPPATGKNAGKLAALEGTGKKINWDDIDKIPEWVCPAAAAAATASGGPSLWIPSPVGGMRFGPVAAGAMALFEVSCCLACRASCSQPIENSWNTGKGLRFMTYANDSLHEGDVTAINVLQHV
jgi:hypothetical protein